MTAQNDQSIVNQIKKCYVLCYLSLQKKKKSKLFKRRKWHKLIYMFKIVHGLVPVS